MPFRFSLFLCGATCAAAPSTPLPLDDAIRLAWANDPAVAALSLTPELARAREEQAGLRPNPEVEFRGSTSAPFKNDSEWAVGVGLSQQLPRRERIAQARALARLGGEAAALHLREQRRRLAGEVRRLYYEAAVQHARRDLARRTLDVQRELRATLERRRAAGEVPASEIEVFNLEVLRAEQSLAFAEAEALASIQRLRGRLRLPTDASLTVNGDLGALLARPIPVEPAPAALETARPAIALAAHHVREADAALALARAETRGDWTVGGGVDFERRANDFTGRLENEPRLSVSASVPWPRTVSNRGDIRAKQAALRIAEAEFVALRTDVVAEIAAALAIARALQPVLAAQHTALASASALPSPFPESLRAAYERGEVTSLQLAQTRQQRFAFETDLLHAVARYATALAEAETAAGLVPSQP